MPAQPPQTEPEHATPIVDTTTAQVSYPRPSLNTDYTVLALLIIAVLAPAFWVGYGGLITHTAAAPSVSTAAERGIPAPVTDGKPIAPAPSASEHVFIQKAAANVRAEPSMSGKIVAVETRGKELSVFQHQGEWVQVGGETPVGWIHSSLVGPSAP